MEDETHSKPVAQPVNGQAQVWNALAEIGRQLQILAQAQLGQGSFRAVVSPPSGIEDSPTVVELVNQFLLAKARAGKSDRYLRGLRNSLGKFVLGRAHLPAAAVSCADLEKWSNRPEWQPRTQRGYLADVRTLYNFGIRRGLLKNNPAAGVELPEEETSEVLIHTPDEVKKVLEFARSYDLNICRALAVRYFAGVRSAEVERMDESAFVGKYVEVAKRNSKTRRRRLVTVQPVLRAWLDLGGELPVRGNKSNVWRDFTAAMTRATGVVWHKNVTRHSFCTYHLAAHESAGKTALEAGHSEAMLFAHYREIVTPEAAQAFFSLYPQK